MSNNIAYLGKPAGEESPLTVVALLVGQPQAPELWTLRKLASTSCSLHVVQAASGTGISTSKRLMGLIRRQGVFKVASRLLGSKLIGPWQERKELRRLDQLFDGEHLREWWRDSGTRPIEVPHLNHEEARSAIARLRPDIIVRVSGGILKRPTFALARIVALNVHHGIAPRVRGMWSIPWGIIEGRYDWIGATIHEIDDGIDTGRVLWHGTPQVSPGDTGTTLFFRAHLEAVDALGRLIGEYANGMTPADWPCEDQAASTYRSAPGLWAWARYLYVRSGKRARVTLERAWK